MSDERKQLGVPAVSGYPLPERNGNRTSRVHSPLGILFGVLAVAALLTCPGTGTSEELATTSVRLPSVESDTVDQAPPATRSTTASESATIEFPGDDYALDASEAEAE
jgi:hypothetical protein